MTRVGSQGHKKINYSVLNVAPSNSDDKSMNVRIISSSVIILKGSGSGRGLI
jgi:hypothetical protein